MKTMTDPLEIKLEDINVKDAFLEYTGTVNHKPVYGLSWIRADGKDKMLNGIAYHKKITRTRNIYTVYDPVDLDITFAQFSLRHDTDVDLATAMAQAIQDTTPSW